MNPIENTIRKKDSPAPNVPVCTKGEEERDTSTSNQHGGPRNGEMKKI